MQVTLGIWGKEPQDFDSVVKAKAGFESAKPGTWVKVERRVAGVWYTMWEYRHKAGSVGALIWRTGERHAAAAFYGLDLDK